MRGSVSDGGPSNVSWAWGVMLVRLFLCARPGFWLLQKIGLDGLPGCLGSAFTGTVARLALLVSVCVWLLSLRPRHHLLRSTRQARIPASALPQNNHRKLRAEHSQWFRDFQRPRIAGDPPRPIKNSHNEPPPVSDGRNEIHRT